MRRLAGLVRRAARRLLDRRQVEPESSAIRLSIVAEADVLRRVDDPFAAGQAANVIGRLGAGRRLEIARVGNVWHIPAFGAVFNDKGEVFRRTVSEALELTPDLARLPNTRLHDEATLFSRPAEAPSILRATVFAGWGGLHSYAHFLMNCLPALEVVSEAGALERFPAIAPPLSPWQASLLRLFLGPDAAMPIELAAPIVRLDAAVFAAPADHFLRTPGGPLGAVRARILAHGAITDDPVSPRRIYLSHANSLKHGLVNEPELEIALAALGYVTVWPEVLSVREQIALFYNAESVVGTTGAGLANILFCRPGARIVEIQPSHLRPVWVQDLAKRVGLDWRAFAAPSSLPEPGTFFLEGQVRPVHAFDRRLDLEAFLAFLAFLDESR